MMNFEEWSKLILETSKRRDEREEQRFFELLDIDNNFPPREKAHVLFQTFSNEPDYGTQERVISTLTCLGDEIYIETLLSELPRLKLEASDWVVSLVGSEIVHNSDLLKSILLKMSAEIKSAFHDVISDPEFIEDFPESASFQNIR